MPTYTLEQFKKLPSAKKQGCPLVIWGMTGSTKKGQITTGDELRRNLAKGMKEEKIDELTETAGGRAVINEYVDQRKKRNEQVEIETSGTFDQELPNGDQAKEFVADHHTGSIAEKINE